MDNFKVLFCLFGGDKFRPTLIGSSTRTTDRPALEDEPLRSTATPNITRVLAFPNTHLQPRYSIRIGIKNLTLILIALVVPIYLVGCGGGPSVSAQLTPPSATSSGPGSTGTGTGTTDTGDTGTTATGGTGSTGTTGTGTTGTGGTGTTGTDGTGSGTTGTGSTGTGTTGTDGTGSGTTGTGSTGTGTTGTTGTGTTGTGGTGSTGSTGTGSTGTGGSGTPGSGGDTGTGSDGSQGTVISNIQTTSGKWSSFGQVGPKYVDCSPSPCEGITWSMKQNVTLPSLSNDATEFRLGGTTAFGDVLFTAALIGQGAPQIQDADHTLLPTLHHFTYDADFYVTDPSITQALEFDISVWMGNTAAMTFGTQCNYLGDKDWDVYDNSKRKWMSAGVPCKFVTGWNHLTIQFQRQSNNTAMYKSITLNGKLYTLNQSYPSVLNHASWWGVNINYQIDGNSKHAANLTYIDNMNVTYW